MDLDVDVGGDGVVEGHVDDDVIDAGRHKVDERLPLEQKAIVDFFRSIANVFTRSSSMMCLLST